MLIVAALAGAIAGSFLTTLIERLPRGESFLRGRSRCPRCRRRLELRDLLPLVSFLWLRGRCRYCRSPIPRWHAAVELASTALFVAAFAANPHRSSLDLVFLFVLFSVLLALAAIDLQTFLLPDPLVAAFAVVGFSRSLFLGVPGLSDSLLGGVIGFLLLGLIAMVPLRGKQRTAMGFGDVKLAGAMGLTLGLPGLLAALFIAFVLGGAWGGVLLVLGRATRKSRIPFGPFLTGAAAVVLLFPEFPDVFFRVLGLR